MASRRLAPAIALAAVALFPHWLPAKNGDLIIEFSTDPVEAKGNLSNLEVRPNTGQPFYLFVRNKSDDTRDVIVQLLSADGRQVLSEAKLKLPQTAENKANPKAVRVMLAKAPPPMPAGAPAAPIPAVPATPAPAPPAVPPPPPGVELRLVANADMTRRDFVFKVRVFDDRDKDKPSEEISVVVGVRQATDYVKPDKITYRKQGRANQLTASFKSDGTLAKDALCPVELAFPPQRAVKVDAMREGVFRRNLTGPNLTASLYAKDMPLRGEGADLGVFNVNVDGVPRAYVYRHSFFTETAGVDATVNQLTEPAIRFMEAEKLSPPVELVTRPRVVPLRVEADTTLTTATFELRIKRLPGTEIVETITRDGTRERHAWLEAAAMDGGVQVTTRVGDWVIPLDLRDLRGRYTLQALLFTDNKAEPAASMDRPLVVDDTKPEELRLEVLPGAAATKEGPPKHLRTKPLPVRVFAGDPESGIAKVVVFFGKLGPDGKLPEGYVVATPPKIAGEAWLAQVPLPAPAPPPAPGAPPVPPEQKGLADVTAVAINGVGLSETVSVRIQLIDPPTGGTIKGTVAMSKLGKGLAGVPVILRSLEDGKEKGATKTNDKGEFVFDDVPPAGYRIYAARPDSGIGTKGTDDVRVQAGKTSESRIILTRRP